MSKTKDLLLGDQPKDVLPAGVVVKGMDPENGKKLASLVARLQTAELSPPRPDINEDFVAGFTDGLQFLGVAMRRILSEKNGLSEPKRVDAAGQLLAVFAGYEAEVLARMFLADHNSPNVAADRIIAGFK